jgi:hypothetical protein
MSRLLAYVQATCLYTRQPLERPPVHRLLADVQATGLWARKLACTGQYPLFYSLISLRLLVYVQDRLLVCDLKSWPTQAAGLCTGCMKHVYRLSVLFSSSLLISPLFSLSSLISLRLPACDHKSLYRPVSHSLLHTATWLVKCGMLNPVETEREREGDREPVSP